MNKSTLALLLSIITISSSAFADKKMDQQNALVIQTDFGLLDGAVSEMQGVAFGVDHNIKLFNLTHEIPAYNTWEASYRLFQTAPYWPKGTVFVSVVDPGVGTDRKSVVLKTKTGQYFVTPDNGTLTLVAESLGIAEVRQIDENVNRLSGSKKSYTFHGRDVYSYTGARLASGKITFEQVGPKLPNKVVMIPYQKATYSRGVLKGNIPVLDPQYGNIWTNISDELLQKAKIKIGDTTCVTINEKTDKGTKTVFNGKIPYKNTFGDVKEGQPLLYLNSLLNVSFALNMDNFSAKYNVKSGADWSVNIKKCN